MAQEKILVIEDEQDISQLIRASLERESYQVQVAASGQAGTQQLEVFLPDLLVLDLGLPDTDGLTLCREVRRHNTLPILMVSARGDDIDRIIGLEVGADDYLAKPFNPKELVARVRALLRRSALAATAQAGGDTLQSGTLRVQVQSRRAFLAGEEVHLTPIEFSLLRNFVQNPGQVLSRQELLNRVWGADFFGDERTVDAHIRNLRGKLRQQEEHFDRIQAVWGVGYRFD
ncbi:MAG: response regulator transcription factor [Candidatus Eremiobacteraeota bacterium]|nr:response regulator transcription factor [Candidatus Eremiobacteraeota bacterium]MCW5869618.1 response regulator transcription factor [Candidatus Eremiobacteraeota bacterium]